MRAVGEVVKCWRFETTYEPGATYNAMLGFIESFIQTTDAKTVKWESFNRWAAAVTYDVLA